MTTKKRENKEKNIKMRMMTQMKRDNSEKWQPLEKRRRRRRKRWRRSCELLVATKS